jgi:RNase P subunit RPR2
MLKEVITPHSVMKVWQCKICNTILIPDLPCNHEWIIIDSILIGGCDEYKIVKCSKCYRVEKNNTNKCYYQF